MHTPPASYRAVLNKIHSSSQDIQDYFEPVSELIERYNYEVALAHVFSKIERAQNLAIYCGLTKIHKIDRGIADSAVQNEHITRPRFRELFRAIFGKSMPQSMIEKIKHAESVRDKFMHGKKVTDREMRQAIVDVIDHAEELNALINSLAGFRPFGELRGFKGAAQPLPKSTSRLVVKGIGFKGL